MFLNFVYIVYTQLLIDVCNEEIEEEESEIESNEEDNAKSVEIIPVKRKRLQHTKRLKIPKFINPNKHVAPSNPTQKVVKPADMFEPVQRGETKNLKIELKMVNKLLDASNKEENTDSVNATDGGFGIMFPLSKSLGTAENNENTETVEQKVITSSELANNRISANGKDYYISNKHYILSKNMLNLLYIIL